MKRCPFDGKGYVPVVQGSVPDERCNVPVVKRRAPVVKRYVIDKRGSVQELLWKEEPTSRNRVKETCRKHLVLFYVVLDVCFTAGSVFGEDVER